MFFIMNKLKFCAVIISFIAFASSTNAQVNDAGLWGSINVEKNISNLIDVQLTQELRLNENFSELGTAFTEAGVTFDLPKGFRAGIAYRFIQKRRLDDSYSFRHRYLVELSYRYKWNKLVVSLRNRFQSQYTDVQSSEDGMVPENYLRTKLQFRYDTGKRWQPFISSELFYQLNNPEGNEIDNMRFATGIDYEINKRNSIEVSYLFDREINVNNPVTSYIIGIAYNFKF
jgi:hypothetical protein